MNASIMQHKLARSVWLMCSFAQKHHTFTPSSKPFSTYKPLRSYKSNPLTNKLPRTFSKSYAAGSNRRSPTICSSAGDRRKNVVFLGTPDVAALVLEKLLKASSDPNSTFDIVAVVTQPGRPKGRKRIPQPSPVEQLALDKNISTILCPERATEPDFISQLQSIQPDLCITAAYGNYLPTKFLHIPLFGTLNIHPSLLPKYRGAAPVQRSLQDGVPISGVSVLYTVKEMDAGPLLAQQEISVDPTIQAPELLYQLFDIGTDLLLSRLHDVWDGHISQDTAIAQDPSRATHAAKLTREESLLDFEKDSAVVCHNKVRGFAGWPGTHHIFKIVHDSDSGKEDELLELKILKTCIGHGHGDAPLSRVVVSSNENDKSSSSSLRIVCGDSSVLDVLEVQAPGRKAVAAKDFMNGMKGKTLCWMPLSM